MEMSDMRKSREPQVQSEEEGCGDTPKGALNTGLCGPVDTAEACAPGCCGGK